MVQADEHSICNPSDYMVNNIITAEWDSGYNGEITITNLSVNDMEGWQLSFSVTDTITSAWNGLLSGDENVYTVVGESYNQSIEAGASVTIGYTANGNVKDLSVIELSVRLENAQEENLDVATVPQSISFNKEGYTVDFNVTSSWNQEYNVQCVITNTSEEAIHNWGVVVKTTDTMKDLYNAQEINCEEDIHLLKNMGWNQDIPVGGSITFGYTACYSTNPDVPTDCSMASYIESVQNPKYEVSYLVTEEWEGGALAQIIIKNCGNSAIEDWELSFDSELQISEMWDGVMKSHSGSNYVIQNPDYAQNIAPNSTWVVSMILSGTANNAVLMNVAMKEVIISGDNGNQGTVSNNEPGTVSNNEPGNISENEVGNRIHLDETEFEILNDEITYYVLDHELSIVTGTLDQYDSAVSMRFVLEDMYNNQITDGDIVVGGQWQIENIGFVVGCNLLHVEAIYTDGTIAQKTFYIINYCADNMYRTTMDMNDSDGDGLLNYYEQIFGTNSEAIDTDGDGLEDGHELLTLGTDPLMIDSDGNGIADGDEDIDGDGLCIITEISIGTDPIIVDTDNDGLTDGEEVTLGTNPLCKDSDGDGIPDNDEIMIGLDPMNTATFGDSDAEHRMEQNITTNSSVMAEVNTAESPYSLSISMNVAGYAGSMTVRESYFNNAIQSDIVIGYSDEIIYDYPIDDMTISYQIKEEYRDNVSGIYAAGIEELQGIKRLSICRYFEEENILLPIETFYDMENNIVYTTTNATGTYCLIDLELWYESLGIPCDNDVVETYSGDSIEETLVRSQVFSSLAESNSSLEIMSLENDNDMEYYFFNGHKYAIVTDRYTWDEANDICQEMGGYLVAINSIEEQEFIENSLMNPINYMRYWTGGISDSYPFNFYWSNGEPMLYQNWGIGEPNYIGELRVEISGNSYYGLWNNIGETTQNGFICEWDSAPHNEQCTMVSSHNLKTLPDEFAGVTRISATDYDSDGLKDPEEINYSLSGMEDVVYLRNCPTLEEWFEIISNEYGCTVNINAGLTEPQTQALLNVIVVPVVSDPTMVDSDSDGIMDCLNNQLDHSHYYTGSSDTEPLAKGLEGGIVGNLYLVSSDGAKKTDTKRGIMGHTFLIYQSYVYDTLDTSELYHIYYKTLDESNKENGGQIEGLTGKDYNILPNEYITIGNSGDTVDDMSGVVAAPVSNFLIWGTLTAANAQIPGGAFINREIYLLVVENERSYYESNAAISHEVSEEQIDMALQCYEDHNYYIFGSNNCATVATMVWKELFQVDYVIKTCGVVDPAEVMYTMLQSGDPTLVEDMELYEFFGGE